MYKKTLALLLTFSTIFTMNVPALVMETERLDVPKVNPGYQVMWTNTDIVTVSLNFSGSRASCTVGIYAKFGTSKISATLLLMQITSNGTRTVKSWTKSVSGSSLYFDEAYYVTNGNTYVLEADASVYRNGTVKYVSLSDRDSC